MGEPKHVTDGGRIARRAGFPRPLRRASARARGDDGAALVEFALVMPILAVLIFGTVDLGRTFQLKNRATNAAREGAIYGQFHPCDTAGIDAAVADEDPSLSSSNQYVVSATACPLAAGSDLTVTVSVAMRILTPLVGSITGQTVTVTGRSTVVVQG